MHKSRAITARDFFCFLSDRGVKWKYSNREKQAGGIIMSEIIVTTGDIKRDHEILGPIYFQVSNKGLLLDMSPMR